MKFSYNWLQSYFDKELPKPEKLAEILSMYAFEAEDVEKAGDDYLIDIDILPNRIPDASGHLGIARELSVMLDYPLKIPGIDFSKDADLHSKDYVGLEVKEPELCPRYVGLLVRGVDVGPSPEWLSKKLNVIGQKSINNIVDIGNYVMLETGQPLHAFDLAKIGGKKIVVRLADDKENFISLDEKEYLLSKNNLVIADEKVPMAIAGIKGGKASGINEDTKDIVIEAAIFDHVSIRNTSRELNLRTDASTRFEHGLSLSLPEYAIYRMAGIVKELAGGRVAETTVDSLNKKIVQTSVFLHDGDFDKHIGIKISLDKASRILQNLGFRVSKPVENRIEAIPPAERTDIAIKEDLIEEVARIYGYEKIPSVVPESSKVTPSKNEEYLYCNWIRGVLSGFGFSEVYNYSFFKDGKIELKNPISSDIEKQTLRESLAPQLRKNIAENFKNFDILRFFEIGKVFTPEDKEVTSVAIAVGDKKGKTDIEAELRGALDTLFIKDKEIDSGVVEIGLSHIIDAAKENGVELIEFGSEDIEYKPFSKYPAVVRDISLFVPVGTQMVEVMDVIENTAGELLIDTDLFDIYEPPDGENKSFAFRLIFQSFKKTLTDKEVNDIMEKIINALEENLSWQVRKQ